METQHLLWFSQDFSPNSFLLIELEESFVQLIENSDSNVYFVGCSKAKEEESPCFRADEAYLCTDRKTFKVLFRESSNCILPIEASQNNCANSRVSVVLQSDIVPVNTLVHGNLELSPTNPRIDVLRRLISQYQSKNNLVNLGIQQILDRVQISELQLKDQLKRMHVVPFEGGLKILTCTEMERVLDDIISTGVLQNWEIPLRLPPANEILKYCDDHPPIMIQHCLDYFCIPRVDNCLRLDEYSVCRFKAMRLFQSYNEENLSLEWHTFETKWQNIVPDFFQPRMDMLSGIAIIEEVGSKMLVHALLEESLPEDIDSRIKLLFQKKSSWSLEELEPYLLTVVPDVVKMEHILRRHCRPLKTIHSLGGDIKFSLRS